MKFKRLIPALAMLLVSAILLGTSTFAWFSMNTTVSATNMQVKAVADQGILINEVATATDGNWDNVATTSQSEGIKLHSTSTANTSTWYVAHSKLQNDAASATAGVQSTNLTSDGYKTLGTDITTAAATVDAVAGSNAQQTITYVESNGTSDYQNGEGYYVMYTYYIKSSADAITLTPTGIGQTFNIKSVTATPTQSTAAGDVPSTDLDKSLRVAVVIGGKAYIFAPISGATTEYYVNASSTATKPIDHTVSQATALGSIPATTSNGTPVYVYIYFEGEDTNLKTSNVTNSLDNITVNVEFELATNATAPTDRGVALS